MIAYQNGKPFEFGYGDLFLDTRSNSVYVPGRLHQRNQLELITILTSGNSTLAPSFDGTLLGLADVPSYIKHFKLKMLINQKGNDTLDVKSIMKELQIPDSILSITIDDIDVNEENIELTDEQLVQLVQSYNKQQLLLRYFKILIEYLSGQIQDKPIQEIFDVDESNESNRAVPTPIPPKFTAKTTTKRGNSGKKDSNDNYKWTLSEPGGRFIDVEKVIAAIEQPAIFKDGETLTTTSTSYTVSEPEGDNAQ